MDTEAPPFGSMPRVIGGRYGLASKEFTPADVRAVFDELARFVPKRRFTVGITDDVTNLSLDVDRSFAVPLLEHRSLLARVAHSFCGHKTAIYAVLRPQKPRAGGPWLQWRVVRVRRSVLNVTREGQPDRAIDAGQCACEGWVPVH